MNEMKVLCALIVELMNEYSEDVLEDGTLTISFDCKEYHYECKIERTIKEGEDI